MTLLAVSCKEALLSLPVEDGPDAGWYPPWFEPPGGYRFSEVLSGLDLHHPPCLGLMANQAFYAIGMLAYNVLISLKVLDVPDEAQGWRIRTLIRHLLTVPVSVSTHARYEVARICVPAGWLRWWRLFVDRWVPKRKVGRPAVEVMDST